MNYEEKLAERLETYHPVARSLVYQALHEHDLLSCEATLAVLEIAEINVALNGLKENRTVDL